MVARTWTPREVKVLRSEAAAGDSSLDIADRLARSWRSVKVKAQKLGLPLGRGRQWQIDLTSRACLMRFLAEHPGAMLKDAALALSRSQPSVWAMTRRLCGDGLLDRVGSRGRGCRYLLSRKWFAGRGHCEAAQYREYREAARAATAHLPSMGSQRPWPADTADTADCRARSTDAASAAPATARRTSARSTPCSTTAPRRCPR